MTDFILAQSSPTPDRGQDIYTCLTCGKTAAWANTPQHAQTLHGDSLVRCFRRRQDKDASDAHAADMAAWAASLAADPSTKIHPAAVRQA